MGLEHVRDLILRSRAEPFTTVLWKEGPILHRPLMETCLADAFAEVEKNDRMICAVGLNDSLYAEIRKFGRNILDLETRTVLLQAGLQGTLWGAEILSFSPSELGDNELILIDEKGEATRFEVAEGYPHEVKIEVRVQVDAGAPVEQTTVMPFAEVEHLVEMLERRFPDLVAKAVAQGIQRR